jgi:GR25 family glycosyltransferase involved in LPS biosynthesis
LLADANNTVNQLAEKEGNRLMSVQSLVDLPLSDYARRTNLRCVLTITCAMLPVVYCTRFLAHTLGLLNPQIGEGFYISILNSKRRHQVREWIDAQNVTFPVTYVPGVIVDAAEYAHLRAKLLAPDTRGRAGCRLAHLNVLRTISAKPSGWYLVVEDDVGGSLAHAERELRWLVALVPNLEALNLYSPTACVFGRAYSQRERRAFCRPLPIFNTRTTGYFVTPTGAKMMIDTIVRRPDLNVDEALAPIKPTFHWLLTFFLRGWVLADALEARGFTSEMGAVSERAYDHDGRVHSRHEDQASMTRNASHHSLPKHQHPAPPARNASHRLLPLQHHPAPPAHDASRPLRVKSKHTHASSSPHQ